MRKFLNSLIWSLSPQSPLTRRAVVRGANPLGGEGVKVFTWFPILIALGVLAGSANAASVTGSGYSTAFPSQPPAADWSSTSFGSSAGTITTPAGMDAAVQGFAAGSITTQLSADPGNPPAILANAVWSSSGLYVQTRPTGNDATRHAG